jgi:hypothetical protein
MRMSVSLGAVARCAALILLCLGSAPARPTQALPLTGREPVLRAVTPVQHTALRLRFGLILRGLSNWLVVWV